MNKDPRRSLYTRIIRINTGILLHINRNMSNGRDIEGKKFGNFTAIRRKKDRNKRQYWLFECDCGTRKVIYKYFVTSGKQKRCHWGCQLRPRKERNTRFRYVFSNIKRRCEDPKEIGYKHYGGRGIQCHWNSFKEFEKDMFKSYLKHKSTHETTSIERIDNDGHYCKENCRWATRLEQANNRSNSNFITYEGRKLTVSQWARTLGVDYIKVFYPLKKGKKGKHIIRDLINKQSLRTSRDFE